jgi:hypothetical protein
MKGSGLSILGYYAVTGSAVANVSKECGVFNLQGSRSPRILLGHIHCCERLMHGNYALN